MFGLSTTRQLKSLWRQELDDHVIALQVSPDGRCLAAASISGQIALIDGSNGELLHSFQAHKIGLADLVWTEAETLASLGHDGRLRFWDRSTAALKQDLDAGAQWGQSIDLSPCGKFLATAAGKKLKIWSPSGQILREHAEHPAVISAMIWKQSKSQLTTATFAGLRFYSPKQEAPLGGLDKQGAILLLSWSPDGRFLASGRKDECIHFFDTLKNDDSMMSGYASQVDQLSWHRQSRLLASGGGADVTVWNCGGKGPQGSTPLSLIGHDPESKVTALSFQRSGELLASGGSDGRVFLWDPAKKQDSQAECHLETPISQLLWTANDSSLFAGTASGGLAALSLK